MLTGALRLLPPETAHRAAINGLRLGLGPRGGAAVDPVLSTRVCGLDLPNPVGLAAGFDKNAEAPGPLLSSGFGFVEVGAVTRRPQAGNPRPRLFRLTRDRAVINRMGFNNAGLAAMRVRLSRPRRQGIVGVNIGANKDSSDRAADYCAVIEGLYGLCDFFTVNVSSPNTEGLRAMQAAEALDTLLARALETRDRMAGGGDRTPVLLKVAPDLDAEALEALAAVSLARGIDGIIATNTTIGLRAGLHGLHAGERGGLSGAPLFDLSTGILRDLARLTKGAVPLIGVGGVDSGAAAYAKIRAGASAVQLYSALVYGGPSLPRRIAAELAALLRRDGYATVGEAVGADLSAAASSAG